MIILYTPDAQDFTINGLGVLSPASCRISEEAGAAFELTLDHPMDTGGLWQMISTGCLIKAPTPMRETPLLTHFHAGNGGQPGHAIYRSNKAVLVRMAPGNAPILERLKSGSLVVYHGDWGVSGQALITCHSGVSGWVNMADLAFVRTEPASATAPGYLNVVPMRQARYQLFRIWEVEADSKAMVVKVQARHISYDQLGNIVKTYSPDRALPAEALTSMSGNLSNAHSFKYFTNLTERISLEWRHKNAIEVLQDPEHGLVAQAGAQLVRDMQQVFVLKNEPVNRGVQVQEGKNLLGVTLRTSTDQLVTRIIPLGKTQEGEVMTLPEYSIDSPHIDEHPVVMTLVLDTQAQVREATDTEPAMDLSQTYAKMREEAQERYEKGADEAETEMDVDFIHLGDTEEYRQYRDLEQVYLYDNVKVLAPRLGLSVQLQVIGYAFDALLCRYESVRLGRVNQALRIPIIPAYQLPNGGITSNKLSPGAVTSSVPPAQVVALSPQNGWAAYGGSVKASKDFQGRVTLSGQLASGALNAVALTLPEGFRPGSNKVMLAASGGSTGYCRVTIAPDGSLKVTSAYTDFVALDGMNWINGG